MIDNVRDDLSRRADTARSELGDLLWLVRMAALAAVAGALYTELRKPPAERTWHGRLLGVVPYDFRIPTLDDFKAAYWNPDSDRLFTDRVLGVGWGINFAQVVKIVDEFRQQTRSMTTQ